MRFSASLLTLCLACVGATTATAADWSNNSMGYRFMPSTAEPDVSDKIIKNVFNFTHTSGDKWGTNQFSIDLLRSNAADPANGGGGNGAQEWIGFYKRSFSLKALTGRQDDYGLFKDVRLNARVDAGTKNTALAPQPFKGRVGASVALPVATGSWDLGLDLYKETNHDGIKKKFVSYDLTPALTSSWAIPIAGGSVEGFVDVIGPKGNGTRTEVLLRTSYMYNLADTGLRLGVGIESWRNKSGCNKNIQTHCTSTSPMLLADYKL
jgi:hypothetical protein